MINSIQKKINTNKAKVGIIGLGYVGIPLARTASKAGFKVIGFDINTKMVSDLNKGRSHLKHIPHDDIKLMKKNGFKASHDISLAKECDVLVICVPTPITENRDPDLSSVISTMDSLQPYLRKGQMLSLESTTWPGTTKEILLPYVEKSKLKIGKDFFLVYSPEREDPGNKDFDTNTIPKILGGISKSCTVVGKEFYSKFIKKVVPVSSTETAEMVKLLENIHRSINIGLVNEMKMVCEAMGIDVFDVIKAASTKPFGFTPYYPGPGIGGHCIPIDPFYLTWKAKEFNLNTKFIELAGEINAAMPDYVIDKIINSLNKVQKSLKGSKVLLLGLSYKKDIDDTRESPSVIILSKLLKNGAKVSYSDPLIPTFPKMRDYKFDLSSVPLTVKNIRKQDIVILLTNHTAFDYDLIKKNSDILIDTRGVFKSVGNVVRA